MNVKYSYIDYQKSRILYREFIKEISIDDVIASFEEIIDKDMLADNTCGIITDLRGVKLDISPKVFKKMSAFMKRNPELYKYKLAAITDSPKQVVLATIVSKLSSKLKVKPFSTYEASVKWMIEDIDD
ncbi:hypothetical protein ACXR6G_07720 [Ancylomarina sp. YFZ004]